MFDSPWTILSLTVVYFGCALAVTAEAKPDRVVAPNATTQDARFVVSPSADPILSAIGRLESDRDAKCHSSASRFEDFVYGTPLSEAARQAKSNLQKEWVAQIWGAATQAAQQAGQPSVDVDLVGEQVDLQFERNREAAGQIQVRFPGAPPVTLEKLRAEQYGSIAYSLRAILAVQQDSILSPTDPFLPLTDAAIERIRDSCDTVTLSVLMLADQHARARSDFEITESGIRDAWDTLLPRQSSQSAALVSGGEPLVMQVFTGEPTPDSVSRRNGLALLDELVNQKVSAYRTYNELSQYQSDVLFMHNIRRFYAKTPLPRAGRGEGRPDLAGGQAARDQIIANLNSAMDAFTVALLVEASTEARRAGHRLIRAGDASPAVQRLIPHQIDEFEDVHLFRRLGEGEHVTLEAFDCDSFRDAGVHWPSLKRSLRLAPDDVALPDPFAAEIIAEAISQYGVLLLRLAGEIAVRDTQTVRLQPDDLIGAAEVIQDRSRRHHDAPAEDPKESRIASAATREANESSDTFFTAIDGDAAIRFEHRTSKWLSEFRRRIPRTPPTFSGGGVAAEDIDGDSDIDLLFVGGIGNALLINDGDGNFADVTERAGIVWHRADGSYGEARQPIIADFDNDGLQDILITYVDDDNKLYRNLGDLRFKDVSADAGLGGKASVSGPATAFDYDGDGWLDLYIAKMGNYVEQVGPKIDRDNSNALPNQLFRNLGAMKFQDVTHGSGAGDTGWAQAVAHVDFDRDGRQDLIVANDFGRNAFLRNLGGGRFENVAPILGVTKALHSMNVGISDLNGDDYPDVYISNIATLVKDEKYVFPEANTPINFDLKAMAGMLIKESDMLYMSQLEESELVGYEPSNDVDRGPTSTGWAWDAEFFDFDHDGDDDLYVVNGTNNYNAAFASVFRLEVENGQYAEYLLSDSDESNVFFVNDGGRLRNRSAHSGADFVGNSRSTAYLDFDSDGDLDIAVNGFHARAKLLRNNLIRKDLIGQRSGLNWLKLRLVGDPSRGSNRDAIGARIRVTAKGVRLTREIQGGSGYLSMNPKQQHFGLGGSDSVDVRIIWPNGEEEILTGVEANRSYTVNQGRGVAQDGRAASGVETRTAPSEIGS